MKKNQKRFTAHALYYALHGISIACLLAHRFLFQTEGSAGINGSKAKTTSSQAPAQRWQWLALRKLRNQGQNHKIFINKLVRTTQVTAIGTQTTCDTKQVWSHLKAHG